MFQGVNVHVPAFLVVNRSMPGRLYQTWSQHPRQKQGKYGESRSKNAIFPYHLWLSNSCNGLEKPCAWYCPKGMGYNQPKMVKRFMGYFLGCVVQIFLWVCGTNHLRGFLGMWRDMCYFGMRCPKNHWLLSWADMCLRCGWFEIMRIQQCKARQKRG